MQKSMENYASSSDEENDDMDEKEILDSLYKNYPFASNDSRLSTFLENALHSGATCLICIGTVRRADAIWSCNHCYCFFHLNCIRRWANDSVAQMRVQQQQQESDNGHYNHLGEFVPPKKCRPLQWSCPNCRIDYTPAERPTIYECFCGKEENPPVQPFLVPHSCGEMCNKPLLPKCGHRCMLLCHPGPCAKCAQYTTISCRCGRTPPKSMRCAEKVWQCTQKCQKRLICGHECIQVCHDVGQCPPCVNSSQQRCECGNETKKRNCFELQWQCKKVCGQQFACGVHRCKKVCHAGPCGVCPLGLPRSCPCGKEKKIGPCSEVIDTCGDTCQKLLPCGRHNCSQRCHRGDCHLCLIITKKNCRCGLREKELPCAKEFTCETKCKQMRDCGKHVCNRKCCDRQCPPCDKICGKPLSCGKHKCQSVCHDGPCYPCKIQSQVNCRCGKTSRTVPCGRERNARILCTEPCRIPSKCHHVIKHRCHKNECPPCAQKCDLPNETSGCTHPCQAKCHAAIKIPKADIVDATKQWNSIQKFDYKALPHPKCEQVIMVTCLGGHKQIELPCWNSRPLSCQIPCNRQLRCGNHKCSLICHTVEDQSNMEEQTNCQSCEEGCVVPRPSGCVHPCPRSCHEPPCAPCAVNIKNKCHCGLTQIIYKCFEYYAIDETPEQTLERQNHLKSCGNRCLKNFNCGHRCNAVCHPGACPNPESCRRKVRITCICKRLKVDISCDKHRAGQIELPCDEYCTMTQQRLEMQQQQAMEKLRLEEAERNRLEVEMFEKKFTKRKYKERKLISDGRKNTINWKLISICSGIVIIIGLAVGLALYEE